MAVTRKENTFERMEEMLEREVRVLGEMLKDVQLETRAEIDSIRLELSALEMYLKENHPEFKKSFPKYMERACREINPETTA